MKKIIIIAAMLCVATGALTVHNSCSTLTQAAALFTCNYKVAGVSNPSVAGVSLAGVKDINSLNATNLLKLTTAILAGSLPITADINIGIQNPNSTAASLAGFDWELYMDNSRMLNGTASKSVNVPANGGTATVPLTVGADLVSLFGKDSREDMFKFANALMNVGDSNSSVTLKIRPTLDVAGRKVSTGFIPLTKNF